MKKTFLLFLICFVSGCSNPIEIISEIGDRQLRDDAIAVLNEFNKLENSGNYLIPETLWPNSIRKFRPVALRPYMFGLFVVQKESSRYQKGIYIITQAEKVNEHPGGGSGVSYERLTKGIFWTEIKVRSPAPVNPG